MLPVSTRDVYNNAKHRDEVGVRAMLIRSVTRTLGRLTVRQVVVAVVLLVVVSTFVFAPFDQESAASQSQGGDPKGSVARRRNKQAQTEPLLAKKDRDELRQQLDQLEQQLQQPGNTDSEDEDEDADDEEGQQQQDNEGDTAANDNEQQEQQLEEKQQPPLVQRAKRPDPTSEDGEKRAAVIAALRHAWSGYKRYAWGLDELKPNSKTGETWFNLGLTITDSLDTLWLAGLKEEFAEAREWVANSLTFEISNPVNLFEVTIRVLGGLLAAFHLTNDDMFLDKATDLGARLCGAFGSSSAIPMASVNLKTREGVVAHFNAGASSTSEATTIQLEFKFLSHLTGDPTYWDLANNVISHINTLPSEDGLVPVFISPHNGQFWGSEIKLGARGDSYYEYLLKQYLHDRENELALTMYRRAVGGIRQHLVGHSEPNKLVFIGEKTIGSSTISPKMDHLVCFLPGLLALGVTEGRTLEEIGMDMLDVDQLEEFKLAEELLYTCYMMYNTTATGLAPEIAYFNQNANSQDDIIIKPADTHNLLRPETLESIFVLWRITHNPKYREWGWQIFQAFEKYSKVATGGYTDLNDVTKIPPPSRDKQESFFLAETLKYLLLLFSDDSVVPLTDYVFNTEAHPLPILTSMPSMGNLNE